MLGHGAATLVQRLLQASSTRSLRSDVDTRQPTIRRENTSMTSATYTTSRNVATYVRSAIQSSLGRCTRNCRDTRPDGHAGAGAGRVVTVNRCLRTHPGQAEVSIRRATVQRATA